MASQTCPDKKFAETLHSIIHRNHNHSIKSMFEQLCTEERKRLVDYKYMNSTALLSACFQRNLGLVMFFVDECHADIDQEGLCPAISISDRYSNNGMVSPLLCATCDADVNIVRFLVKRGANINVTSDSNYTPVNAASSRQNIETVKILVEKGADINITDDHSSTCLMKAVRCPELCKYLISKGADLNATDKKGDTALHHAITHGNLESMQILLGNGIETQKRNSCGVDALRWSLLCYSEKVVERFLVLNFGLTISERTSAYEHMAAVAISKEQRYKFCREVMELRGTAINIRVLASDPMNEYDIVFKGWKDAEFLRCAFDKHLVNESMHSFLENNLFDIVNYLGKFSTSIPQEAYLAANEILSIFPILIGQIMNYMKMSEETSEFAASAGTLLQDAMFYFLEVINIICSLRSSVDHDELELKCRIQSILTLDPRTYYSCYSLLHLAVDPLELSCEGLELLIQSGASVNDLDRRKNTPLHLYLEQLTCPTTETQLDLFRHSSLDPMKHVRKSHLKLPQSLNTCRKGFSDSEVSEKNIGVVTLFVKSGTCIHFCNVDGVTALDLMRKSNIPFHELTTCNLQCQAARVIQKYKLNYAGEMPSSLKSFIERH